MNQKSPRAGLVCIVLLFVVSIGILHSRKIKTATTSRSKSSPKSSLSVQDTIDLITPLLISKSFDAISQALTQFEHPIVFAVLERIISEDKPNLDSKDQSLLFLNIIANSGDIPLHDHIYKLLKKYHSNDPIYAWSMLDNTPKGVERINKIAQKHDKSTAQEWAHLSLNEAVELNDVELLDNLYALGIRVPSTIASQLLDKVVENNNDVAFVSSLVSKMGADPDFSANGRETVLIKAVERKNEPMVRALVEKGANPDKMVDEEVGTPLQTAYENGYIAIERVLKNARKK